MSKKLYEVLKCEGKPGLTVGDKVVKPGGKFTGQQWPYGEESLKANIENKRCKDVSDQLPRKKDSEKELNSLKNEYKDLQKKLSKLKVGKDDEEISSIESQLTDLENKIKDLM